MKVCVLIPSYNESKTISGIVRSIKTKGYDVLVVDDGSTDDTAKAAAREGAVVISHGKNLGKGASIKEGFGYILSTTNYEVIIIMDGDGQHQPEEVDKFLVHADRYNDDLVIGNRMGYTKNMPLSRLLTNKLTSFLISSICKQRIPDTQCGFRLLRRSALERLDLTSSKYDTESEMLIKASRKGFKIASLPVKTIYSGEKSEIHPVKDSIRFIFLFVKSYFSRNN
ncbi:MAG: glycosyltransferase family 2 protein [Candidatus Omnitrophica bacterium]|nr:glycosyltransferase family 2 protein [Candidatus Omnitrophota bacterium]